MDSIPTTPKAVKSKQDYITLAELQLQNSCLILEEFKFIFDSTEEHIALAQYAQFLQQRASIYAQLAIAAQEASAPDDYLSVCRERDVLRSALRAVHEYFQMDADYIHPEGLVQMVAITVETGQ